MDNFDDFDIAVLEKCMGKLTKSRAELVKNIFFISNLSMNERGSRVFIV